MRTINFNTQVPEKLKEASSLINDVYKKNDRVGESMQQSFNNCFSQLVRILTNYDLPVDEYGYEKGEVVLDLYPDFVPGSLAFAFKKNGRLDLNGGMILHGAGETFAVELTGESGPHWSLHT